MCTRIPKIYKIEWCNDLHVEIIWVFVKNVLFFWFMEVNLSINFNTTVIRNKTIVQHQNGPVVVYINLFLSMVGFSDIRFWGVKCDEQESDHEVETKIGGMVQNSFQNQWQL